MKHFSHYSFIFVTLLEKYICAINGILSLKVDKKNEIININNWFIGARFCRNSY